LRKTLKFVPESVQARINMKLADTWKANFSRPKENLPFASEVEMHPVAAAGPAASGGGRKILVVDDNPIVLRAFALKLRSLSFEVLTAPDAPGAIIAARERMPDLILLDINLGSDAGSGQQWDGLTLMQWLRRLHEVASTPIFIMTSGEPEKWKARALAGGAVEFFQKPIQFNDLLAAIFKAIQPA
jgi:CheY-like chemotaxis protein